MGTASTDGAFYEGRSIVVESSLTAAIETSGEPGLVRFLASRASIPAYSLEPTREAEVTELMEMFTASNCCCSSSLGM